MKKVQAKFCINISSEIIRDTNGANGFYNPLTPTMLLGNIAQVGWLGYIVNSHFFG